MTQGVKSSRVETHPTLHWFGQFLTALLQHKQPVWDLLEPPPFPAAKITHIRAPALSLPIRLARGTKSRWRVVGTPVPRQFQRHRDASGFRQAL